MTTHSLPLPLVSFDSVIESDFEDLVALRIEAMRESLQRIGRFDLDRARERFRNGFSPCHTKHIVVDDCRVGFFVLKQNENDLTLEHLYIHPAYQKKCIGTATLIQLLKEADAARLTMQVGALRDSDSNRFYLRHGFCKIGETDWDIFYLRYSV